MPPAESPSPHFSARAWPWACGLALIVFVVFGAAASFAFLDWDDVRQIQQNPNVNRPSWQGVRATWRAPYWGLYIPVSYTALAFEAAVAERVDPRSGLSELRPSVFHVGNLLLHAACTVLVFVLLRNVVTVPTNAARRCPHDEEPSRRSVMSTAAAAGLGALLFAVHPLQVESVAWISEVRGLLCGLFALLALWQYVEYADTGRSGGVRTACYAGATAALLLALLSKPAAVAVPLLAGVLGVGLLRRRPATVFLEILPWVVCAAAACLITKRLQPDEAMAYVPSLATRPLIALDALSFYVGKFFVPLPLGADYGRTPQFVLGGSSFQVGWIILPVLAVALVLLRQRRLPLVGFALFVAWLVPVLGIVPFNFQRISTVADRYVYLSMLGPAFVVAWIVQRWWSRPLAAAAAAVVGMLAVVSFLQLGAWRDTRTLFEHALTVNPRSAVAEYHLGHVAFLDGRHEDAVECYRKSLEYRPDFLETYVDLANCLFAWGKADDAFTVLRESLEYASESEKAFIQQKLAELRSRQYVVNEATAEINLGVAQEAAGRIEEARRHYLTAIRIEPKLATGHYNLGNLAMAQGNYSLALEYYETALKFQPEYAQARANMGGVFLQLGRLQDAIAQERAALIIDRTLLPARIMLGQALLKSGARDKAAVEFRAALSQVPSDSPQAADIRNWLRRAEGP